MAATITTLMPLKGPQKGNGWAYCSAWSTRRRLQSGMGGVVGVGMYHSGLLATAPPSVRRSCPLLPSLPPTPPPPCGPLPTPPSPPPRPINCIAWGQSLFCRSVGGGDRGGPSAGRRARLGYTGSAGASSAYDLLFHPFRFSLCCVGSSHPDYRRGFRRGRVRLTMAMSKNAGVEIVGMWCRCIGHAWRCGDTLTAEMQLGAVGEGASRQLRSISGKKMKPPSLSTLKKHGCATWQLDLACWRDRGGSQIMAVDNSRKGSTPTVHNEDTSPQRDLDSHNKDLQSNESSGEMVAAANWEFEDGKAGRSREQSPQGGSGRNGRRGSASGQGEKRGRYWQVLGVDMSADTAAISLVYFVQGVVGLSKLAVTFFLKDELGLDPAEAAILAGVTTFPWLVKPIYGFISDAVPLFGYRRRSYLFICGILGALAWSSLALFVNDKYSAILAIFLSSLSVAVSDVVVDSMVVERARGELQSTAGSLQSLCWGSSAVGGIVSAYFSGSLVALYGTRFVFGVTAALPLITTGVSILVQEKRVGGGLSRAGSGLPLTVDDTGFRVGSGARIGSSSGFGMKVGYRSELWIKAKTQTRDLIDAIRQPSIFLPTVFIFCWQATPTSETAMFYFITNKLGFEAEFLGRVRLVTSVASLAGVAVYNMWLKSVPLRKIFLWTTIIGTVLGLSQLLLVTGVNRTLGITDEWFAVGDSLILAVLGQISFMPILVLAARICPEGIEATLFATLMSIANGASLTGNVLGGALTRLLGITSTDFANLAWLLLLTNTSSLLALPLLSILPADFGDTTKESPLKSGPSSGHNSSTGKLEEGNHHSSIVNTTNGSWETEARKDTKKQ